MHLPYQYEIVGDGKTRVGVRLSVEVPPIGGGKEPKSPTSPELIGLVLRKTVWLHADRDAIEVEEEVQNPTKTSRCMALFLQHAFEIGGSPFHKIWHMPSARGVVTQIQPDGEGGKAVGADWVRDPTAGWMAVVDSQTKRGLLFAFDYNCLDKMYTCGRTAEWFMDTVSIGPGKTFQTRYTVKPVKGFDGVVFGSPNLMADVCCREAGKAVQVRHDIAAVSRSLSDVELQFSVTGWRSKEMIASRTTTVKHLGLGKATQEFSFTPKDLSAGVVIHVAAKCAGIEEHYECCYAGDARNTSVGMATLQTKAARCPAQGDAYYLKPPHKVKHFDKPDFTTVARPAPDRFKCLVVFGLYTHVLKLDDSLAGWRRNGRNQPEFTWVNCPPNAIEAFPGSYDELFAYNTIVLSDVNHKAIGDIGFEMICDYVEQGGNLIVSGGPYAFGNGEFEGSRFLHVLPVALSGPFDLKWAGEGKSWALQPVAGSAAFSAGVSFSQNPKVFWNHLVTLKKDAQLVLKAGDAPALVIGRYGKGRVAVLTLSPTGEGAAGETPWWNWEGWGPLMKNVFSWLNDKQ